jgi:hypothetical protein
MADDGGITGGQTPAPDPKPTETPAPAPSGITKDEVTQMFKQFGNELGTWLNQRLPQPETQDQTPADATDRALQLMDDPDAVIDERVSRGVQQVIREGVEPTIAGLAQGQVNGFIKEAKAQFDNTYGPGVFEELVETDLRTTLAQLPAALQTSANHQAMILNGIKGLKADELFTKRSERDTMMENEPPQMLSGGGPRPAPKGQLTGEEKDFLAEVARSTGETVDPKEYAAWRDAGPSEDDVEHLFQTEANK